MDFVYFLRILIVEKSIVNSRDKPCIYQVVRIVEWGITKRERERESCNGAGEFLTPSLQDDVL